MGIFNAVTGGGDERNIGFSRRVMNSIHSRNNPEKLRPDMATRENTTYGLARAQNAQLGRSWFDDNAQADTFVSHANAGKMAGATEMARFAEETANRADALASKRRELTRLDPDRPSRKTVRGAKADAKEASKYATAAYGSSRVLGLGETREDVPDPYGDRSKNASTYVASNPREQSPGPVMKGAVLPASYAAGKAVGKTIKAGKKVASKVSRKGSAKSESNDPFGPDPF